MGNIRTGSIVSYTCLTIIVLLICTSQLYANFTHDSNLKIQNLVDIPEHNVTSILQDQCGFIWIGTLDGLHRYDGYQYKTYRIEENKSSINSNMIFDIAEDNNGDIWITQYGGDICKLDVSTDIFYEFPDIEQSDNAYICVDSSNTLWLANNKGLNRIYLNKQMTKVEQVETIVIDKKFKEQKHNFKTLVADKNGHVWVGTNLHTILIENAQDSIQNIHPFYFDFKSEDICPFEDGVVTSGSSIFSIQSTSSSSKFQATKVIDINSNSILGIDSTTIWAGSRQGIYKISKQDSVWKMNLHITSETEKTPISSNIISALFYDKDSLIWIGSRGGGLNILNTAPYNFHNIPKSSSNIEHCIFEDSKKNVWIGTEDNGVDVYRYNLGNTFQKPYLNIKANTISDNNRVHSVEEVQTPLSKHQKSFVWLGAAPPNSLIKVNTETLSVIGTKAIPGIEYVWALENQNDSILWVGTYGDGLWRLKLDHNGEITSWRNFKNNNLPNNISSNIIRYIFCDSNNNVWISTDLGLNLLDLEESAKEEPRFKVFKESSNNKSTYSNYALQITETADGLLLVGTMGSGMLVIDLKDNYKQSRVTTKNGLPNNTIKSIVEDSNGEIWISSNKGLSKYNTRTKTVLNYGSKDGVFSEEFNETSGCLLSNGNVVVSGNNGLTFFNPNDIIENAAIPRMFFTDFHVLNKEIAAGDSLDGYVVLKSTIEHTKEISLEYMHNSFTIGFSDIQFSINKKNNYLCKLEGFDQDWYPVSSDYRLAKYTNVPSGDYVFKVKMDSKVPGFNEVPIDLKIHIAPPFYYSSKAKILYIAIFIMLAFISVVVINIVIKRKREALISKTEKDQIEELTKAKLQFFTNISHEFRTPLTLINSPLSELTKEIRERGTSSASKKITLVKRNVDTMIRLIDQLLDFRKLDLNKHNLNISWININSFVENIFDVFMDHAKRQNKDFTFTPLVADVSIPIDYDKIEKVIYNLLSNAFKYTEASDSISVNILEDNENVRIEIVDSGLGISDEGQKHLFERYYHGHESISGTGIGLSLSKGFIDMHDGKIGYLPNGNKGSVFWISLKKNIPYVLKENTPNKNKNLDQKDHNYVTEITYPVDTKQNKPSKSNIKLLVVEDNEQLNDHIKDLFAEEYRVYTAKNGVEGLHICMEELPDIVISDVMMPQMDGIQFCSEIKKNELTSHIPIILLTAKANPETQIEGYDCGADSFLSKPFNAEVLKARVATLIKNRKELRDRFIKEIEIDPNVISNSPVDTRFLDKIMHLINSNISSSEYSVEQLAEDYGVSRIYLNKKIKSMTGCTTMEFMRTVRLKNAMRLLTEGDMTVSEVAWSVGYNDLRTFRKRFKDKYNLTPSAVIKQARAKDECDDVK